MSDEQKPVEVPKDTVPATEPAAAPKADDTPAVPAETATDAAAPAAVTESADAATAAPADEAAIKEEDAKPIDEGSLEHKGQGANFPKNLIYSKKFFWFGAEPVDLKAIKVDKVADVAHHITAWAAQTGTGLLFFSEKSDKTAPHGVVQLAEASDPVADGSHKFHFTSKGHKHTFKASSTAERDGWVAQLKVKIAEAKELAATVVESETYKSTLDSLKPAKKEDKVAAAEPTAETSAVAEEATPAAEVPVESPVAEAATTEAKVEDKKDEPKSRSASRKRASIFGNLLGKKEDKKPVEPTAAAADEEPAQGAEAATSVEPETTAVVAETAVEAPAAEVAATDAKADDKTEDKKEETTPEVKPTPTKRTSIFGNLPFGKKKAAPAAEPAPAEDAPVTTEPVAESAPVIPAVETTEPLSAETASPATVPAETVEVPPATNGETKEVKSEKRKSSLPFAFGKKEKADKPTSDEEGDKPKSPSAFSRLRATIKGKGKVDKTDKSEDAPPVPEIPAVPAADTAAEPVEETAKVAADAPAPASAADEAEASKAPAATPALTAAA